MKYAVGLIIAILILAAGQAFGAKVTDVELSWQDGFTIARVHVDGIVRYTHQTEEAKDGRPFRVILDVLSATHHLGQKNFYEVPQCAVDKIRTSQFAVKPEKIVRLVFDMKGESVYRIDSDEDAIVVSFPYKTGEKFATWSAGAWLAEQQSGSQPVVAQVADKPASKSEASAPKTAAQVNKEISQDRLASLSSSDSKPSRTGPNVTRPDTLGEAPSRPDIAAEPPAPVKENMKSAPPVPSRVVANKTTEPSKTATSKEVAQKPKPEPKSQPKAEPKSEPKPVAKTVSKPTAKATPKGVTKTPPPTPSRPTASKPLVSAMDAPHPTAPAANYAAATPAKTTPSAPARAKPSTTQAQPKSSSPVKGDADQADEKKPAPRKTSTSRFRRSPSRPTKFQGTLVAEFPKRLVIKYKPGSYRDPFETLINETKQQNSPVERRVPNVEGLRLVGVIESEIGNSALLEDKDGYGYILKEGDKVRKGYVLKIRPEKVFFQIFEYGWSRTVALNLESE